MKQITIRGISPEIKKIVENEAKRKGISLNKAFISLLERTTGVKGKVNRRKTLYHDLDHLAGVWTKEEASMFKKNLEIQRKIDESLWKKRE
ncbi:MAG: hypothetical protein HY776_08440 [Actinobacteria bacterium]|nr:hypothetical protein [Actinomycetota bacterium]